MSEELVYKYSYGEETILGTKVLVYKLPDDVYKVYFKQETFFPHSFNGLESKYKIINKSKKTNFNYYDADKQGVVYYLFEKEVEMTVKAYGNPPPETIFRVD